MQKFLVLAAIPAAAVCQAQVLRVGAPAPASAHQTPVQKPAAPAPSSTQLSAEQRAELRRQLSQYSRLTGKGS